MKRKYAKTINDLPKNIFPVIDTNTGRLRDYGKEILVLTKTRIFYLCFIAAERNELNGKLQYSLRESSTLNLVDFPVLYWDLVVPKNIKDLFE
jgi:hypothetical protein